MTRLHYKYHINMRITKNIGCTHTDEFFLDLDAADDFAGMTGWDRTSKIG